VPIVIGVLVIIAIVIYAWTQSHKLPSAAVEQNALPAVPRPLKVGGRAPAFSLQTPLGAISNDTFAGKPYLLEIFATWCPHCQRMTAVLRSLRDKIPESRFGMLSVTGSPFAAGSTNENPIRESQADVDAFDKYFNVTWLSAFDPDLKIAASWGLDGFPEIFIVDTKGRIDFVKSGEMPLETLLAAAHKAGA
jgi:thiol-disulfide isomerase/thioredoxin